MEVKREDIAKVVYQPDFDFNEFVVFISEYIDVDIPDELSNPDKKEELIDLCYNSLKQKYGDYEDHDDDEFLSQGTKTINLNIETETKSEETNSDQEKLTTSSDKFVTRKDHIIHLAQQSCYKVNDIVKIIDDTWGYTLKKKTSRTRVKKTLRELEDLNLIQVNSDNVVIWVGQR